MESNASSFKKLLAETKSTSLPSPKGEVIIVKSTETPLDGFKKLLEHNILSAPVYDVSTRKYTGFLDMRDLVSFVVFVDDDQKSEFPSNLNEIILRGCKLFKQPSDGVTCTYLSRRNPFQAVSPNDSLLVVCEMLAKGLHRVPVVDSTGNVVNIISQSSIVGFLNQHLASLKHQTAHTIKELNLGTKQVISVKHDTSAINTFRVMDNKKISGVAVIDAQGKFLGNTSASDLKLFIKTLSLEILNEPIMQYLKKIRQESVEIRTPTISCSSNDSLATLIGKLAATKVHKIFIADDSGGYKPDRVVSITDILRYLVKT